MKLVYLIPGLGVGGGAEKSLEAMVPHWTSHHDVHVVTFSDRVALAGAIEAHGARFTNLGPIGRSQVVRSMAELLRRERPDLLHTTLSEADVIGRLSGVLTRVPVSSSLVNVAYGPEHLSRPGANATKVRAWQAMDATTARSVVRFHALTEHVADTMHRRLLVSRDRIEVIPRGRNAAELGEPSDVRREAVRQRLEVGDVPLVVATARHEYQKGLDVLVRAVPSVLSVLPSAMFLIGGRDGAMTAEIHELVDELNLGPHVRFIGQRNDVPDLMCAADAFVVPSRWEGFGSILVEAMALGVNTVAADTPAIHEVAGDPPWLSLFPVGDHTALAARIVETLRSSSGPGSNQLARERFVEGYSADVVATRMMRFFETAAQASRWHSARSRGR
jgi:glycosyltransferase involved in cell wall biosynthesis